MPIKCDCLSFIRSVRSAGLSYRVTAGSQLHTYVLTQLELIFSATHCVWPNSAHVHMLLSIADGRVTLPSASNELEFMGMTS